MARPESIKDVKDRLISVGRIEFDKMATTPILLKHYTGMIEAVEKLGGEVTQEYSGVQLCIPRNNRQLEEQLKSEQYIWDATQKDYRQAIAADPAEPLAEYKRERVREWAEAEGLPNPFDPFASTDEDIQNIRREMGLDNE